MAQIPEDYGYVLVACGFVGLVQGGKTIKTFSREKTFDQLFAPYTRAVSQGNPAPAEVLQFSCI